MLAEDDKWFSVSLRIMGDTVDPTKLEGLLGVQPDTLGIMGQPRMGKQGRHYAPYETNFWSYREGSGPEIGFDQKIQNLFALLGSEVSALQRLSATEGVEVDLFCGFGSGNGQGGDTIQPQTIKLLADAGVSLTLDLYPPTIDSDDPTE